MVIFYSLSLKAVECHHFQRSGPVNVQIVGHCSVVELQALVVIRALQGRRPSLGNLNVTYYYLSIENDL